MKLEDFIAKNRKKISEVKLPEGFSDEMLVRISEGIKSKKERKKAVLRYTYGIAAALTLLVTVGLLSLPNAEKENSIAEIEEYYILIKEINQLNSAERDYAVKEGIYKSVKDITEEEKQSIEEQLPDEISEQEREEIIKRYYNEKNKGLERLRNFLAERN